MWTPNHSRASAVPASWRSSQDHEGSTFRAVYTVKFAGAVYVLHAFQKKSKKGVKTPKAELDLIREEAQGCGGTL